jgi:hypothetical protein
MRRRWIIGGMLVTVLLTGVFLGAAVKDFHVTGTVTGDQGLATSLGGVDTNYVNVNNAFGGVRWQFVQIVYLDSDPTLSGRDVPAGSLGLRHVSDTSGELWFKVGAGQTEWTRIAF